MQPKSAATLWAGVILPSGFVARSLRSAMAMRLARRLARRQKPSRRDLALFDNTPWEASSTSASSSKSPQATHPQGLLTKKPLGIRRAQGQFVHSVNLWVTQIFGRRWTGLLTASAIILALGDAKQTGLSPSEALLLLPIKNLVSFQFMRNEQKAPQDLGPVRIADLTLGIRGIFSDGTRFIDGSKCFQYAFKTPAWSRPFCPRLNAFESPRAPPPMDPPTFC